jgi:hypothetical protein
LARDWLDLSRERPRIIARIESAGDVPNAVSEYQALVGKIDALTKRKAAYGLTRQSILVLSQNRYLSYDTSSAVNDLMQALPEPMRSSSELQQAQANVGTAFSNYEFALMAGGHGGQRPAGNPAVAPSIAGASSRPPGRPVDGLPPSGARTERPGSGGVTPSTVPVEESVRVILQGGPFASAGNLEGDEFFAAKERQREAQKVYGPRIKTLANSPSLSSKITGGASVNTLRYTGDIQDLADIIDFGTVSDVNVETRTITIEMPDDAPVLEDDESSPPERSPSNRQFDI